MSNGRIVRLTEAVIVVDALGTDLLLKGTQGEVREENEKTLTLIVKGNTYSDIPIASTQEVVQDAA